MPAMRVPAPAAVAAASLLALAFALASACSSSSGGSPAAGDDGGTDAGDDGAGPTTLSYTPKGCSFSVDIPETRGFTALAKDDAKESGGADPILPRIGLGGAGSDADPTTTAAFTWQTATAATAAQVRIGTSQSALSDVHAGHSWTLPPPENSINSNDPPQYMHEVHACGLSPATTYYYQVGGGGSWSGVQSFTTVPASGAITIGVSGDSRDSLDVFQLVQQRFHDLAVSLQLF